MLEHSFTAENFRKIFDYENRKGSNLGRRFFPDVAKIDGKLKAHDKKFRKLRETKSKLSKEDYEEEKEKLKEERRNLKQKKEETLIKELEQISADVTNKNFKIKLKEIFPASGKTTYSIENNDRASYFAMKQIQYNFRRLYKIKQSNRYDIIRQLTKVLDNDLHKHLIRTDIRGFYENIPREKILKKINKDPLLTLTSKKIIRGVLSEYRRLTKNDVGIPRGVGISAYLSELHMRSFDEAIMNHRDVAYYARYVDDIIVVFFPKTECDTSKYLDFIRNEASKEEIGLELNDDKGAASKTKEINSLLSGNKTIEYLGYRIEFGRRGAKPPRLHMSRKKIKRYKKQIDLAFKQQKLREKTNKKTADKILVKRILFLSGNTRLVGNKQHVLVGIYYSNSLLTVDNNSLTGLDKYLKNKIKQLQNGWLKKRLERMSFTEGFAQRNFVKFSAKELSKITEVWKHET